MSDDQGTSSRKRGAEDIPSPGDDDPAAAAAKPKSRTRRRISSTSLTKVDLEGGLSRIVDSPLMAEVDGRMDLRNPKALQGLMDGLEV